MAEIFISYKSERRKAAAHLAKILERYGYTVWYDYSLVKGRDFAAQIDAKIREAKALIVLWCSMSVRSEWVADEAALALDLGILVPAKIELCDLRVDFRRKDYVDLTSWTGSPFDYALHPLLDALKQKIGRSPQLAYEAMRDYDEVWRWLGAPSLRAFGLETPVKADREPLGPREPSHPAHAVSPAERDWDRFNIAETEDVAIIKAFIEQYGKSELLWATRARQRLAAVEVLIAGRAEKERLAKEEEAKQRAARYRAEGRIEVGAALVTNTHGRWFRPGGGKAEWFKDLEAGPEMVVAPAGKFTMGSPKGEPQRSDDEGPQHEVTIPKPFAVGRCAVTRGEFAAFVTATGHKMDGGAHVWTGKEWKLDPSKSWRDPGFAQDDSHPVVCVSWHDAQAYIAWLSNASGAPYRLPSEAEWEYSCRAGTATPFWWGSSITPEQANYDGSVTPYQGGGQKGEYRKRTVPAQSFAANPWGLYQVHGNVWEWCEDFRHGSYEGKPENLKATGGAWIDGSGSYRVLRGGSWSYLPQNLRSAFRIGSPVSRLGDIGFRVARTITS